MTDDPSPRLFRSSSDKVASHHLDRLAVVYVRQSTLQRTEHHRESTQLQYGLADRACLLGWPRPKVLVIDEDLGLSGASAAGRAGFQRLVAEVGLGHVGLVLGFEVSRLAPAGTNVATSRIRNSPAAASADHRLRLRTSW